VNTTVHVVVPEGIDDPLRPSGGNVYDRRVCHGLRELGWSVHEHHVAGTWPTPAAIDAAALTGVIAGIPDGRLVVVDGLIGSAVPDVLVPHAERLHVVPLVHMPLGEHAHPDDVVRRREHAVLASARAVLTTSSWTRHRLISSYDLPPHQVHVVEPGVDAADLAPGSPDGGRLICVAAVGPHKGHTVLIDALARLTELPWTLTCVGSLDRDPAYVGELLTRATDNGIRDRLLLPGPLTHEALDAEYAAADLLVLASFSETYGMVVTEALARGLPVIATGVGGLPEALGLGADGRRPGLLVPPGDVEGLAEAIRAWLVDEELRERLRRTAFQRRDSLTDWAATAHQVSRVLAEVAA
jgi:glycosyltransferase involved in cell wall biosynthesis